LFFHGFVFICLRENVGNEKPGFLLRLMPLAANSCLAGRRLIQSSAFRKNECNQI
jgi:hypothetical protein